MKNFDFDKHFETKTVAFDCEKHGQVESTFFANLGGAKPYCSICSDEEEKREKQEKQREIMQAKVRQCGVAELFLRSRFSDYQTGGDTEKQAALDTVKAYGDNFQNHHENGDNLILIGSIGTGKTHLASCLTKQLVYAGFHADFDTLANIVRRIRSTWRDTSETEGALFKRYEELDLLVIDEVGVGKGSDNERNIAYEIINRRYCAIKPTVVVSNCNAQLMSNYIDERSVSRLHHKGKFLAMNWADYRKGSD